MAVLPKPVCSKRALLIGIRHVCCEAEPKPSDPEDLDFAHRDAEAIYNHLTTSCGYEKDDVILMMDTKRLPEHLWPTKERILHQLDQLVSDAPEDCHFVFYFSGHGLEEESHGRSSMRADGRDGGIICADGEVILDYTLHEHLISPLKSVKGSKFFALFDCCHSETLLDLQVGEGPNRYSREWRLGRDQLFKGLTTTIFNLLKLSKKYCTKRGNFLPIRRPSSSNWCIAPASKTQRAGISVICLSACRDTQLAHDDCERKLTFTKCFLDTVAAKPYITWMELHDTLKELVRGIRARYEEAYLWGSSANRKLYKPWEQEPRILRSSHVDLTRKVSY